MKDNEILNYSQKGYLTEWDLELGTEYNIYESDDSIFLDIEIASSRDGFVKYLDQETYPIDEEYVENWFEKIEETALEPENGEPTLPVNHWRCRTPKTPKSNPVNRLEINPENGTYQPDIDDGSIYLEWQNVSAPNLAEEILGLEEVTEKDYRKTEWIEESSAVSKNMPRRSYNWLLERNLDQIGEEIGHSPTEMLRELNRLTLGEESIGEPDNIYILYNSGENEYDSENMNMLRDPSLDRLAAEIVDAQPEIVDIIKEDNDLRPKFDDYREIAQNIPNTSIPHSLRSEFKENIEELDEGIEEFLETEPEQKNKDRGLSEAERQRNKQKDTLLQAVQDSTSEEIIKLNNFVMTKEQQKEMESRFETYSQTDVI